MKRYAYTLITSAILSCFLIGCGGSSKSSSENANAGAPAQQTEPVAPAEPVTPSEQNNPVEPQTAEESSSPETPSAQEEQEEPEEEEIPASSEESAGGMLNLQVIDGYLAQIEACIVKDDDPAMPCDDNFKNADTGKSRFTTDASGKAKINLTSKQVAQLKEKGYVKFKAVAPRGSRDIVFGNETKTTQDLVLVGTKFFDSEKFDKQVADDNTDVFILTPFTTLTEMLLKGDEKITEEKYSETLNKIAESLGVAPDVITTDYNDPAKIIDEKSRTAVLTGEAAVKLNFLPRTDDDLAAVSIMDLESMTAKLESDVKPLVDELKQTPIASYEELFDKVDERHQLMSKSYVSASTGIAEDWRCATNKLNEVVCWGNNAWNNLGNQEFTDKKLKTGEYSEGHENDLMYLKDNYTSEPVNVLVKNPYKSFDDDPDYVNLSGVTKVMTGNAHGCAITIDGEVYCWGSNSSGQLGLGSDEYKTENKNVGYASKVVTGEQGAKSGHLSHVVDLSLGVDHSCALTVEGDIYCWGDNTAMELGDAFEKQSVKPIFTVEDCNGDITDKIKIVTDPVKVPAGDVKFSSISKTGSWAHCALSTEETTDDEGHNLWCWGNDVGGLVTSNNSQYMVDLQEKYIDAQKKFFIKGKCRQWNEDPDFPMYWYYVDQSNIGAKWPMFGHRITNIKSIHTGDSIYVCDGEQCIHAISLSRGQYDEIYYRDDNNIQHQVSQNQKVVNKGKEIKNIIAMDINGLELGPDQNIYFVTSSEKNKLMHAFTSDGIIINGEFSTWTSVNELVELSSNITSIVPSSKYSVYVVTEQNKLYDVGGIPFVYVAENDDTEIPFANPNNPLVSYYNYPSLNAVSVNQRSVCALISEENSDSNMWCWGSKTFGQLGLEYQSNPAYSFGDAQNAWKLDNGYILNQYYYADDSMLDRPTMSRVEIQ